MPTALTPAQIAGYARAAGFPDDQLDTATAVALAESSGEYWQVYQNSDAVHSRDLGLWQINSYWNADVLATGDPFNPTDNARMAYTIWRTIGWNDWVTYKNGRYKQFLGKVNVTADLTAPTGNPTIPSEAPYDLTPLDPFGVSKVVNNAISDALTVIVAVTFIGLGIAILLLNNDKVKSAIGKGMDVAAVVTPQGKALKVARTVMQ